MINFSNALRDAIVTQLKASIDAAATPGSVKFYAGSMPAAGAAITNQVLIATCPLSDPCGAVTNQELVFDVIADDLAADNSGTISFGRIVDGDGVVILDADAGLTASGAFFEFASLVAVAGGTVKITSMTMGVQNG